MLFHLTTLSLAKFLKEDPPTIPEGDTDEQKNATLDAWIQSDFLCRNYILNGLDNALYNVYCQVKSAKELWETLEKKYKAEDAGLKKFIVGRFLDFKMVNSKSVVSQVQELQVILHEIHAERMSLSESFQVVAIIEKLPTLWKDFKNYLKHKRKEMGLKDLIVCLRIEKDNRGTEAKASKLAAKVNIIESSGLRENNNQDRVRRSSRKLATIAESPTTWQRTVGNQRKKRSKPTSFKRGRIFLIYLQWCSRQIWWTTQMLGGLIRVLPATYARTKRFSPHMLKFLGESYTWSILQLRR